MSRGRKLSRQIARYLGSETAEATLLQLAAALRDPATAALPLYAAEVLEKLPGLLEVVDASYANYEGNLALAERNLALSSAELLTANRSISAMVNCLGQGFLLFGEDGICLPVYAKACEELLETIPAGRPIADVLRLDPERKARFVSLLRLAFGSGHAMTFSEIMRFAPGIFPHAHGRHIRIDYKPEQDEQGKLAHIVVIVTDMTEQIRAQALAEERKAAFEAVERALRDRQSFGVYMRHVAEFTSLLAVATGEAEVSLRREAHTLKAGAGAFRLMRLMNVLHDFEQMSVLDNAAVIKTHQVVLQREIDAIIAHFRQLLGIDVLQLEYESSFDRKTLFGFADYLAGRGLTELRAEFIRQVCTESLAINLRHYDLYLTDLAERFNKKVAPIRFCGADVPIVPERYRPVFESLLHLFRNIMDHGIELPDERRDRGKDSSGHVTVTTSLNAAAGGTTWLRLEIQDDGAGIDIVKVRQKLHMQDASGNWLECSDRDVLAALVERNVSTAETVTHYSGRGIGMNAVHHAVTQLGGRFELSTIQGQGTTYLIELPYLLDQP